MATAALTYVTGGPWGPGTGTPLPAHTIDNNMWAISQAITSLNAATGALAPISIASITSPTAGTLAITLTNGQVFGPFVLPAAQLSFQGTWAPSHAYKTNDIFTAAGATYIVRSDHVSGTTFDPSAADANGNNLYGLLLASPGGVLPSGGATGQVLAKHSTTAYDVLWEDPPTGLPIGGTAGQALVKASGTSYDVAWDTPTTTLQGLADVQADPPPADGQVVAWSEADGLFTYQTPTTGSGGTGIALTDLTDCGVASTPDNDDVLTWVAGDSLWENVPKQLLQEWTTTTKTLALSDMSNFISCQGTSQVLTIPPTTDGVIFPRGATFWLLQFQQVAAPVVIAPGSGVTLIPPLGRLPQAKGIGSVIKVTQRLAYNQWLLSGDLAYDTTKPGLDGTSSLGQTIVPQSYDIEVYPVTVSNNQNYNAGTTPAGLRIIFIFTSSGTTSCTITFGTGFKATGTLATGTVSGKTFSVAFISDGIKLVELSRTTAM